MFRGREITHPELGWKLLQRMSETLNETAALDRQPMMEGKRLSIIIAPATVSKSKITEEKKETQDAKIENP
jgi:translation initiation factor IF-3